MKSSDVLSTAWNIIWKNRYLWFFGLVAGLLAGSNQNGLGNSFVQGGAWVVQNLTNLTLEKNLSTIVIALASLLLWPIGAIARIGLVSEVSELDKLGEEHYPKYGQLFRDATKRLLSILLMQLLMGIPVIILSLIGLVIGSRANQTMPVDLPQEIDILNQFGLMFSSCSIACGMGLISIPAAFIEAISFRAMVLENLGVKDGIQRGIAILRENWRSILGMSIIIFIVGLIFSLIITALLSPILLVMVTNLSEQVQQCAANGDFDTTKLCMQQFTNEPTFVISQVIVFLVGAALGSVWVAFQSAVFTVAYRRLT
ncbi:MAG: hypothetical protein JXA42_22605 [Anaerolineales bacterium]|nr:hypothetical protein [Anaerolineales bacterium]